MGSYQTLVSRFLKNLMPEMANKLPLSSDQFLNVVFFLSGCDMWLNSRS